MLRRTLDTVPYYNSTNKYFLNSKLNSDFDLKIVMLALGKEIQVLVGLLRVGERRINVYQEDCDFLNSVILKVFFLHC